MRSLPNIIKMSQYGGVQQSAVHNTGPAPKTGDVPGAKEIVFEPDEDRDEEIKQVQSALERAKEIISNAESLRESRIREALVEGQALAEQQRQTAMEEGFSQGRSEGFEKGRAEGRELGMETAEAKSHELLEVLQAVIEDVEAQKQQILDEYRADMEQLAWKVTEKVLCRQFREAPDCMADILENALRNHRNQAHVRITVSETMASILTDADTRLAQRLERVSPDVLVVASQSMGDGECIAELDQEVLDLGVQEQFANIHKSLDVG